MRRTPHLTVLAMMFAMAFLIPSGKASAGDGVPSKGLIMMGTQTIDFEELMGKANRIYEFRGYVGKPGEPTVVDIARDYLWSSLRDEAVESLCRTHGVKLTDEEIREAYYENVTSASEIRASFQVTFQKVSLMEEGLTEVVENGKDPNQVYDEILSVWKVPQSEWQSTLDWYGTPDKLKLYRSLIPETPEEMYAPLFKQYGQKMLEERLREALTTDIKVSSEDLKQFKRTPGMGIYGRGYSEKQVEDIAVNRKRDGIFEHMLDMEIRKNLRVTDERLIREPVEDDVWLLADFSPRPH